MINEVHVNKFDDSFLIVNCERSIQMELQAKFSYENPKAEHVAKAKGIKGWDGRMKLYKLRDKKLYIGLLPNLLDFIKERGYTPVLHFKLPAKLPVSTEQAQAVYSKLKLKFEPYDFQVATLQHRLTNRRAIVLSHTVSGKSLMIYALAQCFERTLIIDPTVALVNQMRSDLTEDYGCDPDTIQVIKAGESKEITKPITISTWQSLQYEPREFLNQFDCVIADEVHLFTGKQLTGIMERCSEVGWKFGFTGTLEDSLMSEMVLRGLFGPVFVTATTLELIERGILTDFDIRSTVLNHTDYNRKLCSRMNYDEEMQYICMNEERNELIVDLANSLDGNVLILYQYIERHGDFLNGILEQKANRPFYYIHGGINQKKREEYRQELIKSEGNIILASFQTFATGINIPNLRTIILASPTKSKIRLLQSIGRALRKFCVKDKATIYDFGDNLQWRRKNNITMKHYIARIERYVTEGFKYKIFERNMKKDQLWN